MDSLRTVKTIAPFLFILGAAASVSTLWAEVLTFGGHFSLPIPSPDEPKSEYGIGWMDDAVINIDEHLYIDDIDVAISIEHSSALDLQIYLRGPDGTEMCLNRYNLNEFYKAPDYTDTIFDDDAPLSITEAKPPFTGSFRARPSATLRTFEGLDAYGSWHLRICDIWHADTGRLNNFQLSITIPEPSTVAFFLITLTLLLRRKSQNRYG